MKCQFSDIQQELIRKSIGKMSYKSIANTLNEKFHTSFSKLQVEKYCLYRKLNKRKPQTDDINNFIRSLMPMGCHEVTALVNEKFNASFTVTAIRRKMSFYKIKSGLKDKKPINSERLVIIRGKPYIRVKTQCLKTKRSNPNKNWKLKHRILWEQANGVIPKGYELIFLDGNTLNCTLENLCLITKSELNMMQRDRLLTSDPEITKTGLLIIKHRLAAYNAMTKGMDEKTRKNTINKYHKEKRRLKNEQSA